MVDIECTQKERQRKFGVWCIYHHHLLQTVLSVTLILINFFLTKRREENNKQHKTLLQLLTCSFTLHSQSSLFKNCWQKKKKNENYGCKWGISMVIKIRLCHFTRFNDSFTSNQYFSSDSYYVLYCLFKMRKLDQFRMAAF